MSAELVKVTVDEREVHVPKGTGLVETALAAGIEIPVFCYEPRLGAPFGACRMCLVEVEGMPPKPQAACTLAAQDGMVVKTARTSQMAAEALNATLEFILVNHPLDCPVCDKGGECPLQDLTFRYGPGNTRMTFEKHTFEKPIPICSAAPRSSTSMNRSPEIWSQNLVHRWQSTHRSRSRYTRGDSTSGFRYVRLASTYRLSPGPYASAWSCRGHSPPRSQTGQSSGWLISRNSSTDSCAWRA